jgi:PAS domain S-box-containing protein
MVYPEDGSIVDANPAAARYYGYGMDKLKKMNISDINLIGPDEIQKAMSESRNNLGYYFNFEHRLAGGETRSVEIYGSPVVMNGRTYLHSIVHDITERKRAEEDRERLIGELREALSKIKTLSGMLPICAHCKKIRDDSATGTRSNPISGIAPKRIHPQHLPGVPEEALSGNDRHG